MEPLSCGVDRRVPREFNEVPQDSPFWHRCQTLPIIIRVNLLWRAPYIRTHTRVGFGGKGWRIRVRWRSGGFWLGGRRRRGGGGKSRGKRRCGGALELLQVSPWVEHDPTWYNFPNKPVLTWRSNRESSVHRVQLRLALHLPSSFLHRDACSRHLHLHDRVPTRMYETRERPETCSCKVDKLILSRRYCYFAQRPASKLHFYSIAYTSILLHRKNRGKRWKKKKKDLPTKFWNFALLIIFFSCPGSSKSYLINKPINKWQIVNIFKSNYTHD